MNYIGLDLSTKTGFVKLSSSGTLIDCKEICHSCDSPESMNAMVSEILSKIDDDSIVIIEDFGFNSQRGFQLGGIGWLVRWALWRKGIKYHLVAPNALKKFTGAKGNAPKEEIAVEVYKRWEFQNRSNNITDAFVLAHIGRSIHEDIQLPNFQQQVIAVVTNKNPKQKKTRRKKHEKGSI